MTSTYRLSKTRLVNAWQCGKRLWLETYRRELIEITPDMEQRFAMGHRVGAIAQAQFPDGILIGHDDDLDAAVQETLDRLAFPGPVTLFEATFRAEGVLIRADILIRNEADQVRIIEVKSSGEVKDYHVRDCAIQLWVLERCGLQVARMDVAHIRKFFTYRGNGDYSELLLFNNVFLRAYLQLPETNQLVAEARALLDGPEPDIQPGAQCTNPYPCPFIGYCREQAVGPETDMPVHWLPGGARLHARLEADGYRDIRDIPAGHLSQATAEWCRRVALSREPELKPSAADELAGLGWPRYYLDFETLAPAVPVFTHTSPFQMQAFQWSCHIEHEDGELEHHEFLPGRTRMDGEAPMRVCAEALIPALGHAGPVFMYTGYERSVLNSFLPLFFPNRQAQLRAIMDRLFDLHPITKRNYYHPDMRGSWSIKAVLPTIAPELSYADLEEVTVGTEAGEKFLEMIHPDTSVERAAVLRVALLRYCKLDTEAMVRLARFLEQR